jgi:hypothetical protein
MRVQWWLGLIGIGYIGTALILSYDTDPTWWFMTTDTMTIQHPLGICGAYTAACIRYIFGHAAWLAIAAGVALLIARWRGSVGLSLWLYAGFLAYMLCVVTLVLTHISWWVHGGYIGYILHNALYLLVIPSKVTPLIGILLGIVAIGCACGLLDVVR